MNITEKILARASGRDNLEPDEVDICQRRQNHVT